MVPWASGYSALVYEAGNPGSIHGSDGTIDDYSVLGGDLTWYCFQQYQPIPEVLRRTMGSAGNKLFHPYQVGTFVDYTR